MIRLPKIILCLSLLLLFTNCRKQAWDDYYSRPGWLAGPIYQQLKARGNFTLYTTCLERAKYANVLGRTGSFTLFAPNDSAFNVFLKENGYSSVNDLDSLTLKKIVEYSIINNGYSEIQLAAYQDAGAGAWGQNMAFKRRSYYTGFYKDLNYNGFIGTTNGNQLNNNLTSTSGAKTILNRSPKYIPYFIQSYFTKQGLSGSDYNLFYPDIPYTGFNVADAKVVHADIVAENGFINEVNKVILPLPSIDECIASQADYSVFKGILDKFSYLIYDTIGTQTYNQYTGSSDPVYKKHYSISFNASQEEVNSLIENLSQETGWTVFVPNNTTLNQFINTRLLKYYTSVEQISSDNSQILADFLNAQALLTIPPVWPKNLSSLSVNAVQAKMCSNGFFYGTNTIIDHDFNTVFSEVYINPANRIMTEWIKAQPALKEDLLGRNGKTPTSYTVFIPTDSAVLPALKAKGFLYNKLYHVLQKIDNKGDTITAWNDADASNLFLMHIVPVNITSFAGTNFYETLSGEYIEINNNKVFGAGNNERNETLSCAAPMSENNGTDYSIMNNNFLRVPTKSAGYYLALNPQYSAFFSYLKNTSIFNPIDSTILTVLLGNYYTFLIPSNAAIAAAGLPSPTATDDASLAIIKKFLLYHIVPDQIIFTDGKVTGDRINTQAQINTEGIPVFATLGISAVGNTIQITDKLGNIANILPGSNNLAKQSVIHLIDRVLKFD